MGAGPDPIAVVWSMWSADLWDFVHPFYGLQFGGFKSLIANLHPLWEIKATALQPPGEILHGSRRRVSVLGQRRALGAGLLGRARVAPSSSALQMPSPGLNRPVFLRGRSRPWRGYKHGSHKQHCRPSVALGLPLTRLAAQPTS